MYRMLASLAIALLAFVGTASAEQFRGTFVKYEGSMITLKDGDKEKSFSIPTGMKMKVSVKNSTKEVSAHESLAKLNKSGNKPKMNVVYDNVKEKGKEKEVVRFVQFEP